MGPVETLAVSIPKKPCEVRIVPKRGRGRVFVAQHPEAENEYELIIGIDDAYHQGEFEYDVTVDVIPIHEPDAVRPGAVRIDLKSAIDGRSNLIVQGSAVKWYHKTYRPPGYLDDLRTPIVVNGVEWNPDWPRGATGMYQESSALEGLPFSLPREASDVRIRVARGRGRVFVAQTPAPENEYELVVGFDDAQELGAITYHVVVEVIPARIPE
jgi:hypothetical protein